MKLETTSELKKLLEKTNAEISKLAKQRMELQTKESKAREKAKALHVLLADVSLETIEDSPSQNTAQKTSEMPTISQFVANFMASRTSQGTTHKEISEALKAGGYSHHRNYPYVVVSKLKDAEKVTERNGKLFPVTAA